MLRQRTLVLVLLAVAVPATAQTVRLSIGTPPAVCLSIGDARYRIAADGERADTTVRIDPAAAPDIRIRLTASVDDADFVFIEADDTDLRCPRAAGSRTVKIDEGAPGLTLGFTDSDDADYRIYVRSRTLSPQTAAALFAAARMPARLAGRADASH